jgi:hypothetical protein
MVGDVRLHTPLELGSVTCVPQCGSVSQAASAWEVHSLFCCIGFSATSTGLLVCRHKIHQACETLRLLANVAMFCLSRTSSGNGKITSLRRAAVYNPIAKLPYSHTSCRTVWS